MPGLSLPLMFRTWLCPCYARERDHSASLSPCLTPRIVTHTESPMRNLSQDMCRAKGVTSTHPQDTPSLSNFASRSPVINCNSRPPLCPDT